ncbi:MAG: glycine cleavage system aminomethyltransferase GcvT [Thaumarchaeota archaeon]|nr:glycine cleavage system aminomethyltransferase GcvT [Nitrososphaerota archaeon]
MKHTPLFGFHKGTANLTEFAGYEMPLWYTSISDEHLAVRNTAGIFDVSHMGRIVVEGPDSDRFLDRLLPTTASSQPSGKSFYTLFLTERGGIIDDLIALKISPNNYILVVNAANTEKDFDHMRAYSRGYDVRMSDTTSASTMIAVQGPHAQDTLSTLVSINLDGLKRFRNIATFVRDREATISRTGYTGEDGFEIIIHQVGMANPEPALEIWKELANTATPCGLGARDSLRIEAGYPLYGSDITEEYSLYEAELAWVISNDKHEFVGKEALDVGAGRKPERKRRGIVLDEKIPRSGFEVYAESAEKIGEITSGSFSPILRKGIGLGYLKDEDQEIGHPVRVKVRESLVGAKIVKPPFYDESLYGWKRLRER